MKIKKLRQPKIRRLTLKGWAAISDLRQRVQDAIKDNLWKLASDLIIETIAIGSGANTEKMSWVEIAKIYSEIFLTNQPTKEFPILLSKEKGKKQPWEYQGRNWYFWINLFAKNYGWSEEQISNLDIDSAIGLYQETVIDKQLADEWQWGLSEISYEYNKSTKTSRHKPLPRPDWMRGLVGKPKPVPTRRLPARMLPAGTVIIVDEPNETPTTETPST